MENLVSNLLIESIHRVYLHNITFELCWQQQPFDDDSFAIVEKAMKQKIDPAVRDHLKKEGWNWTPFLNVTSIHGFNKNTGGGKHKHIAKEDYHYTITNPEGQPITFRQLTELVYRLKGSKYNWDEELYLGNTFTFSSDGKSVTIDTHFEMFYSWF